MACRWSRPTCNNSRIPATSANCAAFQTADQLRRVQRVAYRTRQLADAHPDRGFGDCRAPALGRRRRLAGPAARRSNACCWPYDWDQAFVGLNPGDKPLVDELFLKVFAELAREHGDELDALIAENLYLDAQRSRRWTVDACKALVEADTANAAVLRERLAQWRPYGEKIIASASRLLARHAFATMRAGHRRSGLDCLGWFPIGHRHRQRRCLGRAPHDIPIDAARAGRGLAFAWSRTGAAFIAHRDRPCSRRRSPPASTCRTSAPAAGCGTCRARLVTGAVASLWADAPGLSERDRRKGDRISVLPEHCAGRVRHRSPTRERAAAAARPRCCTPGSAL